MRSLAASILADDNVRHLVVGFGANKHRVMVRRKRVAALCILMSSFDIFFTCATQQIYDEDRLVRGSEFVLRSRAR